MPVKAMFFVLIGFLALLLACGDSTNTPSTPPLEIVETPKEEVPPPLNETRINTPLPTLVSVAATPEEKIPTANEARINTPLPTSINITATPEEKISTGIRTKMEDFAQDLLEQLKDSSGCDPHVPNRSELHMQYLIERSCTVLDVKLLHPEYYKTRTGAITGVVTLKFVSVFTRNGLYYRVYHYHFPNYPHYGLLDIGGLEIRTGTGARITDDTVSKIAEGHLRYCEYLGSNNEINGLRERSAHLSSNFMYDVVQSSDFLGKDSFLALYAELSKQEEGLEKFLTLSKHEGKEVHSPSDCYP